MIYAGALYAIACFFFINSLFHIWRVNDIIRVLSGAVLFSIGMEAMINALYFSHHIIQVPFIYGSFAIWTSLSYVIFFFLISISFNHNFEWKKIYWLLVVYLLAQIIIFVFNVAKQYSEISDIILSGIQNNTLSFYPYEANYFLHSMGALALYPYIYFLIFSKFDYKKNRKAISFFTLFLFLLSLIVFFDVFYLFKNREPEFPSGFVMAVTYFCMFIFVLLYQFWPYYHKLNYIYFDLYAIGVGPYMRNYLEKVDIKAVTERFNNIEKFEELYKDENFNLKLLSERLNLTIHQTSEYLNKYKNISFTKYLNQLRIKEATRLLKAEKEKSILEICYEVGYNSPAVFYRAFKQNTGVTPKIWRENNC